MNKYEKEMLAKLDSGETLSEHEISELVYEFNEVDRDYGENRRWSRGVCSIIEIGGRYFEVIWEQGLTENQENEFWEQPYEVEKHIYEKTVKVTEWKRLA